MLKQGILAKNTFINFMGQAIPLAFAVVAIPFVIDGLGTDRFGVLTIVWIVIGYFGLFDMGVGRATTKFVADIEAKGDEPLSPIIVTSIVMLLGIGILGSLAVVLVTPPLVAWLEIPPELLQETTDAFYILSVSIPLVLGSIGARGALEAQQRFGIVNIVKIPASILNYIAPLLILPFSNSLQPIMVLLVAGRAATFFIYLWYSLRDQPLVRISEYPLVRWGKEMLGYGAWITASNVVSPIMMYMDRIIFPAALGVSAVAYYTAPFEGVTRLLIIAGSFMGVMFPAFSVASLEKDREELGQLHGRSVRYILLALVPPVLFLVLAAEPLLHLWLGADFAVRSTPVLQLLAVGVLANSVAMVPYTALQAMGRPDITGKLHLVELPIYLAMIWYFTLEWGITGVALAWVLRVVLDGGLLLWFFHRLVPSPASGGEQNRKLRVLTYVFILVLVVLGFYYVTNWVLVILYSGASAIAAFLLIWRYGIQQDERKKVIQLTDSLLNR